MLDYELTLIEEQEEHKRCISTRQVIIEKAPFFVEINFEKNLTGVKIYMLWYSQFEGCVFKVMENTPKSYIVNSISVDGSVSIYDGYEVLKIHCKRVKTYII